MIASLPPQSRVRMTIDEMARLGRTTTRHVRALQTQGLIPHPHLVGRTGVYDEAHLQRLQAVLRLQHRGFSLAAIGALVDAWQRGATLDDVLGLRSQHAPGDDDDDLFGWAGYETRGATRGDDVVSVVPTTLFALTS